MKYLKHKSKNTSVGIIRRKEVTGGGARVGVNAKAIHRRRLWLNFLSGPLVFGTISNQLKSVSAETALVIEAGPIVILSSSQI